MKNLLSSLIIIFLISSCAKKEISQRKMAKVSRQTITQKITIAGSIRPRKTMSVVAPYDGYIKKIFVKLGQNIEQGADLLTIGESLIDTSQLFPLKASFSGKVVQINKSEGEFVRKADQQGQILQIDDLSNLYIYANIPEIDYLKLKLGQEVTIRAMAIVDKKYKGKVTEIFLAAKVQTQQWSAGNQAVEYPIKIEILNEDKNLRPGMSTIVDVIADKKENVLALPHEYVFNDQGQYFVTTANGEKKSIQVGLRDEFFVQVLGLKEGLQVQMVDFYADEKSNESGS